MPVTYLAAIVGVCIFLVIVAVGMWVLPNLNNARDLSKQADPRLLRRVANSEKVLLSWRDANEITQTVDCRLLDISEQGLGVRSKLALGLGTHLYIKIPKLHLATTANVRRCEPSGWKFDLGLEFRGPLYRT